MAATTPDDGTRRRTVTSLLGAAALVAAWQVVFVALVSLAGSGSPIVSVVMPPLVALAVPAAWMSRRGWWGRPWVARMPSASSAVLLLPLLLVDVLMLSGAGMPPAGLMLVLAFFVTGASEELLARGVVQELLAGLRPLPQVLLTGGLPAVGYAVGLSALGLAAAHVLYIAGMVLCFGVAHAALRRRGVPVVLLAVLGGLVVWPQFARDAFDPLTLVASVVALGFGLWTTAEEPTELRRAELAV